MGEKKHTSYRDAGLPLRAPLNDILRECGAGEALRIARRRASRRETVGSMAEAAGLSPQTVGGWMRGQGGVDRVDEWIKMLAHCGFSVVIVQKDEMLVAVRKVET